MTRRRAACKFWGLGIATALLLAGPAQAVPVNLSFTGNFAQDDDVQLFSFVATGPSNVTLLSHGYAGGVNALGAIIARGGFDPNLAVFDATGALLAQNDDGGNSVPPDALTDANFDSLLELLLPAGTYTVALTQIDNIALGPDLSGGFARTGQGNFTTTFNCPDAQPAFNDVSGLAGCGRTNAFAFDVRITDAAEPVPAPLSIAVLATGLLGLAAARRR